MIVELDDEPGIRFCGNVVDTPDGALDQVDPHSLEIGAAVEVCFAPEVEGIAMPRWRRAELSVPSASPGPEASRRRLPRH